MTAQDLQQQLNQAQHYIAQLTQELAQLHDYHLQVLQHLPLAACAIDDRQRLLFSNSALGDIMGLPSLQLIGKSLSELPAPWNTLLTQFLRSDKHVLRSQFTHNRQNRVVHLHKAILPSLQSQQPLGGMVILIEDLTHLHRTEAELAHQERLASIGRLAAGVAHEIGNPVTGIACIAQNLRYESQDADAIVAAEQTLELTTRISRIVQSLITFSHSGITDSQQIKDVCLYECVEEAINLARLSPASRNYHYHNQVPETLSCPGDQQRLLQVFLNLLNNARDASAPEQAIVIKAHTQAEHVEIHIIDQGCGMTQEVQDRMFEPFFTTKEPGQGTGLGLPLVYRIIQSHNGELSIFSEPKKGTDIVIRLPFRQDSMSFNVANIDDTLSAE